MSKTGKRGRPSTPAPSATRAQSLRGRPHNRLGKKMVPMQSRAVPVIRPERPDPDMKRLPRDCFNVVFRRRSEVPVAKLSLPVLRIACVDCGNLLGIDKDLQRLAETKPDRELRPMRYICRQCFWEYFEGFSDRPKEHSCCHGKK